jgi:predicted RNA-binding protein YlqC (UPF0109 family)
MVDLIKFIVSAIIDHPDSLKIVESIDDSGTHIITLTVDPSDMGKVIGKGGKIISAIRELVKVKAIKQGKRVRVTLQDPDQPTQIDQPSPSAPPETPPQTS